MAFKDLLVVADGGCGARERLRHAANLAVRFGAHLAGLYVIPVSRAEAAGDERRARQQFDDAVAGRDVSTEWRAAHGFPIDVAVVHARYADLTILGQLDLDDPQTSIDSPAPEIVALSTGRPVLIIPYAGGYGAIGQRVLVAWDASREAARAVNDALPLLVGASAVTVLTVDPRIDREVEGDVPGADIALHLARHGVNARVEMTVSGGIGIGDVLLSRAADLAADLLVMGAYGHSRVRELVLGGTTRTVLESMTLPVLLSH